MVKNKIGRIKIMEKMKILYLLILILIICQSCDIFTTKPKYKTDIEEFIEDLNLEKTQEIKYDISIDSEDIYFFHVKYGPPQDCPSGCHYRIFYGLKNSKKINSLDLYDIDTKDSYLFTDKFFQKVKKYDEWYYYCQFLPILARDEDTPIETLTKIANNLYTYISPHIGSLLIENIAVQIDKNILLLIANLPVFQGDAYEEVRQIAKNLLENIE